MDDSNNTSTAGNVAPRRLFIALEVLALSALKLPGILNPRPEFPSDLSRHSLIFWQLVRMTPTIASLGLLLFIIFSSGDGFKRFGIRRWQGEGDWLATFAACALVSVELVVTSKLFPNPSYSPADLQKMGVGLPPLLFALGPAAINWFYGELFFRAYWITRIEELTGIRWLAALSSAIFLIVCEGTYTPALIAIKLIFGIGLAAIFIKNRSVWPLVASNALYGLWIIHLSGYF